MIAFSRSLNDVRQRGLRGISATSVSGVRFRPGRLQRRHVVDDADPHVHDQVPHELAQGTYTITLKGNETGVTKVASSTTPILLPRGSTLNLGAGGGATTTANRNAV